MTQDELFDFINLQSKFQKRCEAICKILKPLNYSYYYLSNFHIEEDKVYGKGNDYSQYGSYESYSGTFPTSYLCMSDDALKKIVEDNLKKREKRKRGIRTT